MRDTERQHLENLISTYRRRLRILEQQDATFGIDARPHVKMEIEDLRAKITEIESDLANLMSISTRDTKVESTHISNNDRSILARSTHSPPKQADFVDRIEDSGESDSSIVEKRSVSIKALIIEDNPSQQLAILRILEEFGCLCVVSQELDEALNLVRSDDFGIITVDMQLDEGDFSGQLGYLVLDQILLYQRSAAVIVISGLTWKSSDVRNFFVDYKAFDFFSKPFNPNDLKKRISVILKERG